MRILSENYIVHLANLAKISKGSERATAEERWMFGELELQGSIYVKWCYFSDSWKRRRTRNHFASSGERLACPARRNIRKTDSRTLFFLSPVTQYQKNGFSNVSFLSPVVGLAQVLRSMRRDFRVRLRMKEPNRASLISIGDISRGHGMSSINICIYPNANFYDKYHTHSALPPWLN